MRRLHFEAEQCLSCHLCELACSAAKTGVFGTAGSRLRIEARYSSTELVVRAGVCNLCLACIYVCPTGAVDFAESEGRLVYDEDLCTGCGLCVDACPEQCLTLEESGTVAFCDMCGGDPECVKWCPRGALTCLASEGGARQHA